MENLENNENAVDFSKLKKGDIKIIDSGDYYEIDNEKVLKEKCVYDHYLGTYTNSEKVKLIKGIVKFLENNTYEIGSFSKSIENVRAVVNGNNLIVMSDTILPSDYIASKNGSFQKLETLDIYSAYEKQPISKDLKSTYDYGVSRDLPKFLDFYKMAKVETTSQAKLLAKILDGLSVGVEFETSKGKLTEKESLQSGLIPLRDGSINGLEYVTIPLEGEKGCQYLINAFNILQENTDSDDKCALHYHFGNIPRTEEFIVALWIVMTLVQDDLFKLQPFYKRESRGAKQKDYSQALPNLLHLFDTNLSSKENLNNAYSHIYSYLTQGDGPILPLSKIEVHPRDVTGRQKWNVATRYSILNFIPLIFGNKKTVEFRQHEISVNADLVVNELIINSLIINYVKKNTSRILKGSIDIRFENILNDTLNVLDCSSVTSSLFDFMYQKKSDLRNAFVNGKVFMELNNVRYYSVIGTLQSKAVRLSNEDHVTFFNKYYGKSQEIILNNRLSFSSTYLSIFDFKRIKLRASEEARRIIMDYYARTNAQNFNYNIVTFKDWLSSIYMQNSLNEVPAESERIDAIRSLINSITTRTNSKNNHNIEVLQFIELFFRHYGVESVLKLILRDYIEKTGFNHNEVTVSVDVVNKVLKFYNDERLVAQISAPSAINSVCIVAFLRLALKINQEMRETFNNAPLPTSNFNNLLYRYYEPFIHINESIHYVGDNMNILINGVPAEVELIIK